MSLTKVSYAMINGASINVLDYGAVGDGVTDDTAAIDAALTQQNATDVAVYFPTGTYKYTGAGFASTGNSIVLIGEGPNSTIISLGASSRLIDTSYAPLSMYIAGICFSGGLGAFRNTYSGVNVSDQKIITRNKFINYTVCAIDINASDCPYWKISYNEFYAANSTSTIGIALNNNADSSEISNNSFLRNAHHLKLRQGGLTVNVFGNDFLEFDVGSGARRSAVWLVPHTGIVNAGVGCSISTNKFGNETQQPTDYRILIADEGSGTYNGNKLPVYTASTGYVISTIVTNNKIVGAYPLPVVYSTTPNLQNNKFVDNFFDGVDPTYIIEYLNPPNVNYIDTNNQFINNYSAGQSIVTYPVQVSNGVWSGVVVDPTCQYETYSTNFHSYVGGIDAANFVRLASSALVAPSGNAGATKVSTTDSTGGSDAYIWTFPVGSLVTLPIPGASITVGQPTWFEFDLAYNATSPITEMVVQIAETNSILLFQRHIAVYAGMSAQFRFPVYFRNNSATTYYATFAPVTPTSGTVVIGRIRVYHGRDPMPIGRSKFEQFDLSDLPTSSAGLAAGSIWVDVAAGKVLKRV
jgi:hypothetical protein